MRTLLQGLIGLVVGTAVGAMIGWLTCGTVSYTACYLVEPNPELIHPFFFAANLGSVFLGAPIGFIVGLVLEIRKELRKEMGHANDREGDV
jgi:hypothetical protein